MRVLLTGATGFIGSYFCNRLQAAGHEVVGIDLWKPNADQPLSRFVHGDIRDPRAVRVAMEGCEAVLSLAAAHHDFGIDESTYYAVNLDGSQVILDEMDRLGIGRVCWYSSCAVYGDAQGAKRETTEPRPNHPYGASKLAGEGVFRNWASRGGRSALVIRPTITFGPGNVANMYSLIRQIASGKFLVAGRPKNVKSLSYVENLVEATMTLWPRTSDGFEVYNFVEKPDLTSLEIANVIAQALGRRRPGPRLPMWMVLALAKPFDLASVITGRDFGISSMRVRKLFLADTCFEADKLASTGFRSPVSLPEGIHRMVRWWQDAGRNERPSWRIPPAQVRAIES